MLDTSTSGQERRGSPHKNTAEQHPIEHNTIVLADFGKAAECSLAPVIRGESLDDCQHCIVVVFRGMVLCGIVDEEILAALGHLPEYPTCPKAVGWCCIRCCVYFAWPIEPSLQNGSAPRNVFRFFWYWIRRPATVHPFCLDEGLGGNRWLPRCYLSFPGTFHRAVLSYYGCQVSEACNFAATYGVEDSDVHAVVTEE